MKLISYLAFFIIASISLCITSCSDESDATPISVWFDDNTIPYSINSGMRINIKAQLRTGGDEHIKRYTVFFDDGRQDIELKSEELSGNSSYNIDFYTEIPYIQDEKAECKIKVKVEGNSGFQNTISKKIIVYGALQDNSAGFKLYASNSEENDGFYLSDLSITYKKSNVDSLDVYFYYNVPTEEWTDKCEGWKTDCENINFVLANNYDYAKATAGSLQNTYESSVKVTEIRKIEAGNIIIIGYNGKAWGVFNCMAYDSGSRLYTFSYKLIGK